MSNTEHLLRVSDFSRYPGPRYRADGPYSGQEFREQHLGPALRAAIAQGGVVIVELDDVAGYGSSFLEEVFGGLVREGFNRSTLNRHLQVVARTSRFQHHRVRALRYMADAAHHVAA